MGNFFTAGESKIRPGIYQRYENTGSNESAGAVNGIVAMTIRSNWGKLGVVHSFGNIEEAKDALGSGGGNGTVSNISEAFRGGARTVKVVRLGSGGTNSVAELKDDASTTAINVSAKCEGSRSFTYTIRTVLGDAGSKELIVYDGSTAVEKYSFAATGNEAEKLLAAAAHSEKFNVTMAPSYSGTGTLENVVNTAFTAGTDPVVANEDYSKAFVLLEPERWNTISVDTNETAVHALLAAYIDRVYSEGKHGFAVVGEPTTVALTTRQSHATSFNDYKVVYVGGGYIDTSGETLDGHRAAARVSGMIAAIPSSDSLTRKAIKGATAPAEILTNTQYEACIRAGMLTFSASSTGIIWVDSGINTLVTPSGEDDAGWKKIKRTKIRFELMQRASDSTEPLIGNIPNNSDGLATVIKTVQGVLNDMISESKLLAGAVVEVDPSKPPSGDSAWFIITADDVDSMEKIYFLYKFRFSPNA